MENSVPFLKRKMPVRTCFVFFVIIFGLLVLNGLLNRIDLDLYYVIATGREIVENGFPHVSVWNIDRTEGFVVQQWLYCVAAYYLDQLPLWSYSVFAFLQVALLAYLSSVFLKIRGLSGYKAWISIGLALFIDYIYIFSHRPETITLVLLMLECIALEKFKHTGKSSYLLLLPISMILEMNVHAAMWPVHYAILAAYFVPSFYFKKAEDMSIHSMWRKLLPHIVVMTLSMFINPYGFDGVGYAIKSLTSGAFSKLDVYEMNMPYFVSQTTGILIIVVFFLFFVFKFGKIDSVALNMIVGFTFMSFLTYRHMMFSYFTMLFVMSAFLQIDSLVNKIDLQKDMYNYYYVPFVAVLIVITGMTASSFIKSSNIHVGDRIKDDSPSMYAILEYFDENNVDKHTPIFTFETGSYLEYFGYDNVYFDTRYELYSSVFTGNVDYADDFYMYCSNGTTYLSSFDMISGRKKAYMADDTAMKQWLDKYGFEYLIVGDDAPYLAGYLSGSSDYEFVDVGNRCDDGRYLLGISDYALYRKVN